MSVSTQELLKVTICSAYGCTNEADFDDGLCREHSPMAGPARPRAVGMEAPTPLPTPCRREGCLSPSTGAKTGPYARLCEEHTAESKEARAEAARERALTWHAAKRKPAPLAAAPKPEARPVSLVSLAQSIEALTAERRMLLKQLDELEVKLGQAIADCAEALDAERRLADVTDPARQVPATAAGRAYRHELELRIAELRDRIAGRAAA